nr:hypothetical protein ICEMyc226_00249 [Mycolicibacterium sp.]
MTVPVIDTVDFGRVLRPVETRPAPIGAGKLFPTT